MAWKAGKLAGAPPLRLVNTSQNPGRVLEAAYREYAASMTRVAFRILGRQAEAQDVVQDAFVELMRKLPALDTTESLGGWLTTVTVRACWKKLRRRRLVRMLGLDREPHYEDVASPDAAPETRAFLAEVYRVLERIPPDQRLAWSLRYLEGMRLDAVARQCECSLATVKRRIAAAHELLEAEVAYMAEGSSALEGGAT